MIEVTLPDEGELPSLESLRELIGDGAQKRSIMLEIIATKFFSSSPILNK